MNKSQQTATLGIWDRPIMESFAVFCNADPHTPIAHLIGEKPLTAITNAPKDASREILKARLVLLFSMVGFALSILATLWYSTFAVLAMLWLFLMGWAFKILRKKYEPTSAELYDLAGSEYHRQNVGRLEEFRENIRAGNFKIKEDVAVPNDNTSRGKSLKSALAAGDHGRLIIVSDGPFDAIRTFSRKPDGRVRIQRGHGCSATLLTSKELINMPHRSGLTELQLKHGKYGVRWQSEIPYRAFSAW